MLKVRNKKWYEFYQVVGRDGFNPNGRFFVAYFYLTSLAYIQFGFHVSIEDPNIEIHIPFGFIRVGWIKPCNLIQEIEL